MSPEVELSVLDVGARVAGFEIESYVARGGMAVVYRAREVGLGGRTVALKVIAPELAQDPTFRQRFTQESQLAASIDHPNIIPIYAAGEADGQLYLVMRYVDGETLGAVFKNHGPLGPAEVLAIFSQVAGALDAAHSRQLVHRDVKPKNILLVGNAELSRRHVYLSDFGLTKRISGDTSVTTTGQFLGTIRYVAPEQISNAPISHRADIYSLGCVIFEALTGQPPFLSEDEAGMLWAHMSADPPAVSQHRPGLPLAVDDVLRRALAKDPAERQPTCHALVAEFGAALQSAPNPVGAVSVSSGTPPEPSGVETVELRTIEAMTPGPPVEPEAGSPSYSPVPSGWEDTDPRIAAQPLRPPPAPPPVQSPPPRRRSSALPFVLVGLLLAGILGGVVLAIVQTRRPVAGSATSGSVSVSPSTSASATASTSVSASVSVSPSTVSVFPQSAEPLADDTFVWRQQEAGLSAIVALAIDRDERQELVAGLQNVSVQLTPDRRTILYLSESKNEVITLRAMAADGTQDKALFKDGSKACPRMTRPTVRADGLLVLMCNEVPGGKGRLNLMTVDGTLVRVLDRGRLGDPTFSPDGSEITYWRAKTAGSSGGSLYRVPVDGGEPEQILAGKDGEYSDPAWSPTGDQLLATRTRGNGAEIIAIEPTDDGSAEVTPLTTGYADIGPSWSPDASQIIFRRGTNQLSDLYLMNADGTDARKIFHTDGYASRPVWTAH